MIQRGHDGPAEVRLPRAYASIIHDGSVPAVISRDTDRFTLECRAGVPEYCWLEDD